MERIAVFRFVYFDRAQGSELVSSDYATLDAIREMGGAPLPDSRLLVGKALITPAGLLTRRVARGSVGLPFSEGHIEKFCEWKPAISDAGSRVSVGVLRAATNRRAERRPSL